MQLFAKENMWYNGPMKLFGRNGKPTYDSEKLVPAIRSSICTGEKVAGFKDKATGHFSEVVLIRSDRDLDEFRKTYGIEGEIEVFY